MWIQEREEEILSIKDTLWQDVLKAQICYVQMHTALSMASPIPSCLQSYWMLLDCISSFQIYILSC